MVRGWMVHGAWGGVREDAEMMFVFMDGGATGLGGAWEGDSCVGPVTFIYSRHWLDVL